MDEAVPFRSEPSFFETCVRINCDNVYFAIKIPMYQVSPKKQGYLLSSHLLKGPFLSKGCLLSIFRICHYALYYRPYQTRYIPIFDQRSSNCKCNV